MRPQYIILIIVIILLAGAGVYFYVMRDTGEKSGNTNTQTTNTATNEASNVVVKRTNGNVYIWEVTPAKGEAKGGTPVTIKGSNFVEGIKILFDDKEATDVVMVSDSEITAVTPEHAVGVVSVFGVNPDGKQVKVTNGFTYE